MNLNEEQDNKELLLGKLNSEHIKKSLYWKRAIIFLFLDFFQWLSYQTIDIIYTDLKISILPLIVYIAKVSNNTK